MVPYWLPVFCFIKHIYEIKIKYSIHLVYLCEKKTKLHGVIWKSLHFWQNTFILIYAVLFWFIGRMIYGRNLWSMTAEYWACPLELLFQSMHHEMLLKSCQKTLMTNFWTPMQYNSFLFAMSKIEVHIHNIKIIHKKGIRTLQWWDMRW